MLHEVHDAVSLALAQRIAEGLPAHPQWLELAKGNLERWAQRNHDAPALLACYREWQTILERPVHEIIAALLGPSPEGQRLRQNSPFAGALRPNEVWLLKRQIHETTAT